MHIIKLSLLYFYFFLICIIITYVYKNFLNIQTLINFYYTYRYKSVKYPEKIIIT